MNEPRFASVDELVADARSRITRLDVHEAAAALDTGARLVDIRPEWQRREDGEIPGAVVVDRNHLEWRLHPESGARIAAATPGQRWIVYCTAGYTSSLAADALQSLGIPAADIVGGFHRWRDAGLPTVAGGSSIEQPITGPDE